MITHRNKEPYRSSNIYRVTASVTPDFKNLTPFEKLEAARKVVFNFDYPTPDSIEPDEFKRFLEQMFVSHFWERWFRAETFESFSIQLYSKMLEVLPAYNIMLDVFFRDNKDEILMNHTIVNSETKDDNKQTNETENTNKNIASAFPANMMSAGGNIGNVNYANNGNLTNDKNESVSTQDNKRSFDSDTLSGVMLDSLIKFNKEYSNIFTKLLNEFNILFSYIIC